MQRLLILGAGGYGRAVAEAAQLAAHYEVVGFVDDRWPALPPVGGVAILSNLAGLVTLIGQADVVVPAIGDNVARQAALQAAMAAGFGLANIVHPQAFVSPSARLGRGITVMAGAVVGTEAQLCDGAIVNAGAMLDHHARVGICARVGVGACMGGGAVLGDGAELLIGLSLPAGMRLPPLEEAPKQGF